MIAVIVGAPSAGKTTVLKQLQEKGFRVFHADSFITEQYKKGMAGYQIILDTFGPEFVLDDKVNRKRIREEIDRDAEFLTRLNEVIHPLIKDRLEEKDNFIAELPIITSSPVKFNYDKVILVTADKDTLYDRLEYSLNDNEEFLDYIISKWDNNIEFDFVVDTTKEVNIDELEKQLLEAGLKHGN